MPYILRVTWLRHARFPENFFTTPARLPKDEAMYQICIKSLAQAVLKICLLACQKFRGHVTSHAPLGKVIYASSRHSICELATDQIWSLFSLNNFQDIWDRLPQIFTVTWPRPRSFWGKLFERPLGFYKRKLRTKFEVSSSSSFEDTFDRILKILGGHVT